LLCQLG